MLKVAGDVGGAFADICVLETHSGPCGIDEVPSTPGDQSIGFMNGILAGLHVMQLTVADDGNDNEGTTGQLMALWNRDHGSALQGRPRLQAALHRRPQDAHREVAPLLADANVGPTRGPR